MVWSPNDLWFICFHKKKNAFGKYSQADLVRKPVTSVISLEAENDSNCSHSVSSTSIIDIFFLLDNFVLLNIITKFY
jgi:hypothetical protein